jgi:hypothetical protein
MLHHNRAKHTILYSVAWATAVKIDLIVMIVASNLARLRQIRRVTATQLQRHRMLCFVHLQMPMGITIDNRTGSHHLGIQHCMLTNQAQEIATVAVSPVHHRSDTKTSINWLIAQEISFL